MLNIHEFPDHTTLSSKDAFLIHLSDYEGPLDLLLELARKKKFDLVQISISELARQYIAFIETAQKLKIEIAADYLVMAAYLAWLKSRLLLPANIDEAEELAPEQQAEILRRRLLHLEKIKLRATELFARKRLGQDFFKNGQPTSITIREKTIYHPKLFDLLQAYATIIRRKETGTLTIASTRLFTPEQMQERLKLMIGTITDWTEIKKFLPECSDPLMEKSALAGLIVGGLSLVKAGIIDIQQTAPFAPIYIKNQNKRPKIW